MHNEHATVTATAAAPRAAAIRRIADLPSPPGLPLLGHATQVQLHDLHLQLEQWRHVHGDAYRFRMGPREFIVLGDPEAIAAVLRDRPEGFQRTPRMMACAKEMGFDGVFAAGGEAWRRQRPMVMAGFDPAHLRGYFPTLVKVTQRFARRWQRAAEQGTPIDLLADLMRYTVDVTAGLAFGSDTNTLESDGDVIQQHLNQIFPALYRRAMALLPYWHFVRLPSDRRLDRSVAALRDAVDGFIAQARARLDAEPARRERPTNLIEAMIAARDLPDSGVDDRDVAGNVLTMLLAGEDTTANTLAWAIYLLHRHPAALQRARAEVSDVLGADRLPSRFEQLDGLDYVRACTYEAMRLKPVAPILPQQALRDSVVGGIELPAGTLVMLLLRASAIDERHFAAAPTFEPSRWLADGPAAGMLSSAKRVAMPFGAGARMCPGRYLAVQEMRMVLAMLLGSFEIEHVGTEDGSEPREHLAFTMGPAGLQLRLKARG